MKKWIKYLLKPEPIENWGWTICLIIVLIALVTIIEENN